MIRSFLITSTLLLALTGCPTVREAGTFGLPCTSSDTCDPGQLCRESPDDGSLRCLPPHSTNEPGESCAAPQRATATGDADVFVDQQMRFAGVADDEVLACSPGARPERVIRFEVPALAVDATGKALERPGIEAFADDPSVSLSLRRVDDSGCTEVDRYGCAAPGETLLQQRLEPGAYVLVVERAAVTVAEPRDEVPVHVVVRQLDCPVGALPFDDDRCIRTSRLQLLSSARANHTMERLDDGTLLAIAGEGAVGDYEAWDPALKRWRYGTLGTAQRQAGTAVRANGDVLLFAGDDGTSPNGIVLDFSGTDGTLIEPGEYDIQTASNFRADVEYTMARAGNSIALFNNSEGMSGLLRPDRRLPSCSASGACQDGEVCVTSVTGTTTTRNVCMCAIEGACGDRAYSMQRVFSGPIARRGLVVVGDRYVVLATELGLTNEGRQIGIVDAAQEEPPLEVLSSRQPRRGGSLVHLGDGRVVIAGGTDSNDVAVDTVEILDLSTRDVVDPGWTLPVPMAAPHLFVLGGNLLVVPDAASDEVFLIDPQTGRRRPSPFVTPRTGVAGIVDGDGVVVTGGTIDGVGTRLVERIELVARTAPPVAQLSCFAREAGNGPIAGDTSNSSDTFHSRRCEASSAIGRDNVFSLHLDEQSSVMLIDFSFESEFTGNRHFAYLLRGDCDSYEEIACGDADDDPALFAGDVPPGDYLLVVESGAVFQNQGTEYVSGAWDAFLRIGPPTDCPVDANDPVDDDVTGATWIGNQPDRPEFQPSGRLCPGDVDHVLIETFGDASVSVSGTSAENMTVHRAIIDSAASAAAGHPVAAAITGPAIADLSSEPPGFYVVSLTAEAGAVDFSSWALAVTAGCVPDIDDSLFADLDNDTPARAVALSPGVSRVQEFCTAADRDLIVLNPVGALSSTLSIGAAADQLDLDFFSIEDGVLGAALTFPIVPDPNGFTQSTVELGVVGEPIAMRMGFVADTDPLKRFSAVVEFAQRQIGDTCDSAFAFAPDGERSGTVSGDATAFNDDVSAINVGDCTGYVSPGKDVFFAVELATGETIELAGAITGEADDIALFILDSCTLDETACVAGIDSNSGGVGDELSFTNEGAPQTFYVVIDSYEGAAFSYELDWSISGP